MAREIQHTRAADCIMARKRTNKKAANEAMAHRRAGMNDYGEGARGSANPLGSKII